MNFDIKLKSVEETASTCKFWDFRVQEVIIQRFLISEVKHQDFNMDLGDLVASAEQLTAEIDGVRIALFDMPNLNRFDILSILIFCKIAISISISIFSKITISISINKEKE